MQAKNADPAFGIQTLPIRPMPTVPTILAPPQRQYDGLGLTTIQDADSFNSPMITSYLSAASQFKFNWQIGPSDHQHDVHDDLPTTDSLMAARLQKLNIDNERTKRSSGVEEDAPTKRRAAKNSAAPIWYAEASSSSIAIDKSAFDDESELNDDNEFQSFPLAGIVDGPEFCEPSPPAKDQQLEEDLCTWQPWEITGHKPTDPDDDGTGLNGIGFVPTRARQTARRAHNSQAIDAYVRAYAVEERRARARDRARSKEIFREHLARTNLSRVEEPVEEVVTEEEAALIEEARKEHALMKEWSAEIIRTNERAKNVHFEDL